MAQNWHTLLVGGGRRDGDAETVLRLSLPAGARGYADAQIDDYGGPRPAGAPRFRHQPGLVLSLRARFSPDIAGTAGFGFWNAPYGDPATRRLALPAAAWFFYASAPNDLPFAPEPGRGWFAATLDSGAPRALALLPLAPATLLLNQFGPLRRRLWPAVRRRLGISAAPLAAARPAATPDTWRDYRLEWRPDGCCFLVDGAPVLTTTTSPRGPLGFVCWVDNQYLVLTPRGRFRSGYLPVASEQWLEVAEVTIRPPAKR